MNFYYECLSKQVPPAHAHEMNHCSRFPIKLASCADLGANFGTEFRWIVNFIWFFHCLH